MDSPECVMVVDLGSFSCKCAVVDRVKSHIKTINIESVVALVSIYLYSVCVGRCWSEPITLFTQYHLFSLIMPAVWLYIHVNESLLSVVFPLQLCKQCGPPSLIFQQCTPCNDTMHVQ